MVFPEQLASPLLCKGHMACTVWIQQHFVISRNRSFWLVGGSYALTATFYSWGNVWNVNLEHLGLTESESGWLGFYTTMSGAVAAVVVSL